MTEPTAVTDTSSETKTISRRRLLKIIAAAGGAVTASSMLPAEWVKPLVEIGMLPVHAQDVSPTLEISDLSWIIAWANLDAAAAVPYLADGAATFAFHDPLGQVDDTATLFASIKPCGEIVFDGKALNKIPPFYDIMCGTPFEGKIGFLFNTTTGFCGDLNKAEFCVKLGVDSRRSNELCELRSTTLNTTEFDF
jgi:hypothetical protein